MRITLLSFIILLCSSLLMGVYSSSLDLSTLTPSYYVNSSQPVVDMKISPNGQYLLILQSNSLRIFKNSQSSSGWVIYQTMTNELSSGLNLIEVDIDQNEDIIVICNSLSQAIILINSGNQFTQTQVINLNSNAVSFSIRQKGDFIIFGTQNKDLLLFQQSGTQYSQIISQNLNANGIASIRGLKISDSQNSFIFFDNQNINAFSFNNSAFLYAGAISISSTILQLGIFDDLSNIIAANSNQVIIVTTNSGKIVQSNVLRTSTGNSTLDSSSTIIINSSISSVSISKNGNSIVLSTVDSQIMLFTYGATSYSLQASNYANTVGSLITVPINGQLITIYSSSNKQVISAFQCNVAGCSQCSWMGNCGTCQNGSNSLQCNLVGSSVSSSQSFPWYYILLICLGCALLIVAIMAIIFGYRYFRNKRQTNKNEPVHNGSNIKLQESSNKDNNGNRISTSPVELVMYPNQDEIA